MALQPVGGAAQREKLRFDGHSSHERKAVQFRTAFFRNNRDFLYLPPLFAALLAGLWTMPCTSAWLESNNYKPLGLTWAVHYLVYAIVLMFSVHGFVCCFDDELAPVKLQGEKPLLTRGCVIAERSFFTLTTSLLYAGFPVSAQASTSWISIFWQWLLVSVIWDLWFFLAHRAMHLHPRLYKALHKTHHEYTDPNCFVAYYVAYGSHVITEQAPMFIFGLLFSRDVLLATLYLGTFSTFLHHSGYDVSMIRLMRPWPGAAWHFTVGSLLPHVPGLAQGFAEHDVHHEKFLGNYALSFSYLDKICGSFVGGRRQGKLSTANSCQMGRAET